MTFLLSGWAPARGAVRDLEFRQPNPTDVAAALTLQSVVKVADTEGLYLMTHYGEREELFRKENQALIDDPFINDRSRHCTVFSAVSGDSVIIGRNWDNQNVGAILVSLYHPPRGYSSISFSRSIDMGFEKGIDLDQVRSLQAGKQLLLAPFYAMDGINEHGLAVAVAANEDTEIEPRVGKELVFITFLIRKILDQTKTVDQSADLVEDYVPFLLESSTLSAHLLVADATGRSVVLEYAGDEWKRTFAGGSWQVMSTKPVYGVPDSELREVAQAGTTWSIVYVPTARELRFCVYQEWDDLYRLVIPESNEMAVSFGLLW